MRRASNGESSLAPASGRPVIVYGVAPGLLQHGQLRVVQVSQAGREAARAAGEVAAPARRHLLSYVEALPRFGAREARLWRAGGRWRPRTSAPLHPRNLP